MNVEDSYEGAVRRLQRLGHVALVPPKPTRDEERERELEELATLACDENERLKAELETAPLAVHGCEQLLGMVGHHGDRSANV